MLAENSTHFQKKCFKLFNATYSLSFCQTKHKTRRIIHCIFQTTTSLQCPSLCWHTMQNPNNGLTNSIMWKPLFCRDQICWLRPRKANFKSYMTSFQVCFDHTLVAKFTNLTSKSGLRFHGDGPWARAYVAPPLFFYTLSVLASKHIAAILLWYRRQLSERCYTCPNSPWFIYAIHKSYLREEEPSEDPACQGSFGGCGPRIWT